MKLPRTVKVGGPTIRVARENLSDDDCFGYYSHDRKVIVLHDSLEGKKLVSTLRHEVMEAALCISGVGFCETMETEAIVRCCDEVYWPAWDRIVQTLDKSTQPPKE